MHLIRKNKHHFPTTPNEIIRRFIKIELLKAGNVCCVLKLTVQKTLNVCDTKLYAVEVKWNLFVVVYKQQLPVVDENTLEFTT